MRDSIRKTRRGSRRFVSLLATGVLLLVAWVLATNTVFGPADTADPEAVEPTAVIETATEFETAISKSRKADALERIASSSDETAMSEEKPAPVAELTHPVVVAGVAPSMGGTETLLSPYPGLPVGGAGDQIGGPSGSAAAHASAPGGHSAAAAAPWLCGVQIVRANHHRGRDPEALDLLIHSLAPCERTPIFRVLNPPQDCRSRAPIQSPSPLRSRPGDSRARQAPAGSLPRADGPASPA